MIWLGAMLIVLGPDGFAEALGYILILDIPIPFWCLAAILSFATALKLPKGKENLKNVLLGFPILFIILVFAIGEYHGP